jgi:hypothetical protein
MIAYLLTDRARVGGMITYPLTDCALGTGGSSDALMTSRRPCCANLTKSCTGSAPTATVSALLVHSNIRKRLFGYCNRAAFHLLLLSIETYLSLGLHNFIQPTWSSSLSHLKTPMIDCFPASSVVLHFFTRAPLMSLNKSKMHRQKWLL